MEEIRRVTSKEINIASELIYETTIQFETSHAIKNDIKSKKMFFTIFKESFNDMELFGYYIDNLLIGIIGLEDNNYIPILYIKKEYQKKNIGTKLLNYIKKYTILKTNTLEVCADSKAVSFYQNNGFIKNSDEDIDKVMMYYTKE